MTTRTVECVVDAEGEYGDYANAFRVLKDGPDILLDFCLYSEAENKARIVARLRVPPTFLRVVLSRLSMATCLEPVEAGNRIYVMPEVKGLN